ncbi:AbrB family transcriptional regulator [Stappia sp. P2PMeth1]|uniref:AbrB family transcriptional regulator n=1 Tax=Stappia sp. P2PMeth1 TaxID=2003586 RepID=UPI0016441B83|nr:AbrB family transcriptional regulator [Stappia sp. P2PMeth1]
MHTLRQVLTTLAIGALGGGAFHLVGLPAAWLAGAMVATAAAVLSGVSCKVPDRFRDLLFVILGLTMGAGVTPETVDRIGEWPLTMALVLVSVAAVLGATYLFQRRIAGWDRHTAYFAAIPGALSYVMILSLSYPRADTMRVAIAQTLRVFILVSLLPPIIAGSDPGGGGAVASAVPLELLPVSLVAGVGLVAGYLFQRLGVPAGWLTGPFFVSAALNASGALVVQLPDWLIVPALIGLGCLIGCRFTNIGLRDLLRLLLVSLGAFAVGMSIAVAISLLAWSVLGLPLGQLLLAYAPGGLEAMTLLAFLLDLDPAFVAAHQLARYIGMVLILPFVTRRILGPPDRTV